MKKVMYGIGRSFQRTIDQREVNVTDKNVTWKDKFGANHREDKRFWFDTFAEAKAALLKRWQDTLGYHARCVESAQRVIDAVEAMEE